MSRVFWDTMLLIYLLEDHPQFYDRVDFLLRRSQQRGDRLFTSCLAVGEMMAGASKSAVPGKALAIREILAEIGFTLLPFDEGAIVPFTLLRSRRRLRIADSVHLACAASAGIDLFLTGDQQLLGLDVPGIQFIADLHNPIL